MNDQRADTGTTPLSANNAKPVEPLQRMQEPYPSDTDAQNVQTTPLMDTDFPDRNAVAITQQFNKKNALYFLSMSTNPTHVSAAIEPSSEVQGHDHFNFH
jgi:hypothetical protein